MDAVPTNRRADLPVLPLTADGVTTLLGALTATGVEFVVVGGLAVYVYGGRAPEDVDVTIRATGENCVRAALALRSVYRRLDRFDLGAIACEIAKPISVWATDLGRLDLVHFIRDRFGEYRIGFDRLVRSAIDAEIAGVHVRLVSLADLIDSKRTTGRAKDWTDVCDLSLPERSQETPSLRSAM